MMGFASTVRTETAAARPPKTSPLPTAGVSLTRPLTRLTPVSVGEDLPWCPLQQEWLHPH
jgi:hypothetical protein